MAGFCLLSVVCIFVVYCQDRVFAGEFKCNDKLREQDHMLCAADSPYLISSGVSATDRDEIVNLHNRLRGEVKPPAMDMPKLIWDYKLEAVAQKKANKCKMEHETYKQRNIPAYGVTIGQNLAAGYYTWERAIMGWYNEKEDFEYGIGSNNGKTVGHYTQVVSNKAVRVGCGYAKCSSGNKRYFACNYAVGQSSISHPYTEGKSCAKCLGSCKKGLCDCGGKLCKNRGKINLETCQCECTNLYTGNMCEELSCPKKDAQYCGVHYVPSQCEKFSNVPQCCPYMCGICKNTGCEWTLCKNGGTFDMETCGCECPKLYKGPTCEEINCPQSDDSPCGSWSEDFCTNEYASYMKRHCPFKCGYCKKR